MFFKASGARKGKLLVKTTFKPYLFPPSLKGKAETLFGWLLFCIAEVEPLRGVRANFKTSTSSSVREEDNPTATIVQTVN